MSVGRPSKNNPPKSSGKKGGPRPGAGRPKGVPNRLTTEVKDMVRAALDKAGGVDYLVTQATENPKAFLTLVGKLMPLDVNSTSNVAVTLKESRDAATAAFLRSAAEKRETIQ